MSHFLVNIRSTNIDKVFSMLSSQRLRRFNVDKPTLFQRWYFWYFFENESWINVRWLFNVETTLAYRRWIVLILSMLFCNFDKYTSAQLYTKFQRCNFELTWFYRLCFVNVETKSINVRRLNFQSNINVETTLMNANDQRWCVCTVIIILSSL